MKNFHILYNIVPKELYEKVAKSDTRSKEAIENILISLIVKVSNILSSLLVLPLTISYINPTRYGIWLSISTVVGWVYFFDLGLGNGFRNKFAEAKAQGNTILARQYLTTTYFAVTSIVTVVYILLLFVNANINWATLLNVSQEYREELHRVFCIIGSFICLNMIANIFGLMLNADQKPGYASIIQGAGQYLSLAIIFVLTKVSTGSLTNLAIFYSGIPAIVMLTTSFFMFKYSHYRIYRPKISYIRLDLIKNIIGLGAQFFIISLCLIIIFQVVNIILSRELGPVSVTQYNVANRYFNVLYMFINIIVTPFWSAFTDAYTKGDLLWMKNTLGKLEKVWLLAFVCGIIMLAISPYFYKIWIGNDVDVSLFLSFSVMLMILSRTLGNIYMFMINGIGTVRIQLITYIVFAIVAWPSLVYSCRWFGVCGIVIVPTIVYGIQSILARIQLNKHISNTAKGIWLK